MGSSCKLEPARVPWRVQVCNLNPVFDKINDAKPLTRISKGFTAEMYWGNSALYMSWRGQRYKRWVQVANLNPLAGKHLAGSWYVMKKNEIVKKNLGLHGEWMKYVFEHPEVLDRIPKGAVLVILPEDDEVLYDENYKVLEENKMKGIPVFVVTMKTPKPQISNIEVVIA